MNATEGVRCAICHDSVECSPFKLTCGHAFGKSCMRVWMENSGQKNCAMCRKELTHDEITQINDLPLYDRTVNILKKATPIFTKTASFYLRLCSIYVVVSAIKLKSLEAFSVSYITSIVNPAVSIPTGVIGALGAAAGVPRIYSTAAGAAFGASVMAVSNNPFLKTFSYRVAVGVISGASLAYTSYSSRR
ncbi:RING finger domain-containing protein [Endozoicomonas sp. 8E]|uniref:RING finger domain-containing protein n=1 Tax=Endozoicomonas sp. 8E TaxID=3035692 RepID=UPI00293909DB|nr:RING finger domain-containing protein [Endozoicomonas sp. 8E]WOG27559.1 RING finger domain-containing protein [Endozoicomonas sp. 8E]